MDELFFLICNAIPYSIVYKLLYPFKMTMMIMIFFLIYNGNHVTLTISSILFLVEKIISNTVGNAGEGKLCYLIV